MSTEQMNNGLYGTKCCQETVHLRRGDSFLGEYLHCAVFFSFSIKSIILGQISNIFQLQKNTAHLKIINCDLNIPLAPTGHHC